MNEQTMKELLFSLAWLPHSCHHSLNTKAILEREFPGSDFTKSLEEYEEIVTNKVTKEMLESYSKEISRSREIMTIEELIESHRSLRETNRIYHTKWREEVSAAVENRVKMAIDDRYVLLSDLEKMTLEEIALRIS